MGEHEAQELHVMEKAVRYVTAALFFITSTRLVTRSCPNGSDTPNHSQAHSHCRHLLQFLEPFQERGRFFVHSDIQELGITALISRNHFSSFSEAGSFLVSIATHMT